MARFASCVLYQLRLMVEGFPSILGVMFGIPAEIRIIAVPGLRWAKDRISPWQSHLSTNLAFASDVCFQQGRGCRDFVACNLPIITLCLQRRIPSMVWDMPVHPSLSAELLSCSRFRMSL